jgi:hypothetical protein
MENASEVEKVKAVADAARKFLAIYHVFDGDLACVGEYLDALIEAVDAIGD